MMVRFVYNGCVDGGVCGDGSCEDAVCGDGGIL